MSAPGRGGMARRLYVFQVTPTKPEGYTASGDDREYVREVNSGRHFPMKKPPPDATPRKVNKLRLDALQHVRRHETKDEGGFATISDVRKLAVKMNQIKRGDRIDHADNAALRAAAKDRLRTLAKHEEQIRKMLHVDKLKRERQEAAIMARLHNNQDKHLLSILELRGAEETVQDRADDMVRVTSAVKDVRDDVCALGEETAEGEADGEESDEGSQAEEQDTPPLDSALTPSLAIAVPEGRKVAEPQQVAAVTATVSTDSVMVGRPLSPPASRSETESSVDVSPRAVITPAPTGPLYSPELEAAPSAPGAARVVPVSSEPELSSDNAELEAPATRR